MNRHLRLASALTLLTLGVLQNTTFSQGTQIPLNAAMIHSDKGDAGLLIDEQKFEGDTPATSPQTQWQPGWKASDFPAHAVLDLGQARELVAVWLYDVNAEGKFIVSAGSPGDWKELFTDPCDRYKSWKAHPVNVTTRYLRFTKASGGANVAEVVLFQRSEEEKKARSEAANRPMVDAGPPFGPLPLVDEIRCGDPADPHSLAEDPQGASHVETILDQPCRVLPNQGDQPKFFAYRMAKGKLLEPGKGYVLCVDYPEDQPRSLFVLNRGAEACRGLHTGNTVGDALHPKYVGSNPESLALPLSGKYRTWRMLFFLHDRFSDLSLPRDNADRPLLPPAGFPVIVSQFGKNQDPTSAGAAVARIRLFEAPDAAKLRAKYTLPEGLPHRHLFYREEMADGVVQSRDPNKRGVTNDIDWFEYRARVMQFLGMNTYCWDLLEFGHNQGWDAGPGWYNQPPFTDRWQNILAAIEKYHFTVLPYYEYCGSIGPGCLGVQKRCKPLSGQKDYTHISWSEKANADVTDPDTLADAKKLLDRTIVRFKDKAGFVGAWFRPRVSGIPISFSDRCLDLFAKEANQGAAITREKLKADRAVLDRYYAWWFLKRRDFLVALRDHLRTNVDPKSLVLFTTDTSEPGLNFADWKAPIVAEDPRPWTAMKEPAAGLDQVLRDGWYRKALLGPRLTWGNWEWQHSCPWNDPDNYRETDGVLLTCTFNRAYTVGSPETLEAFRGPSGLAMVRHYCLNENMMGEKLGYFVGDMELAGPFTMLAEARAMANGDPFALGYLAASSFNCGFPEYVRDFNTAFLSLPALPSVVLKDACSSPDVVVRAIQTPKQGTYLAVVNTGYRDVEAAIRLPKGKLFDAPTGESLDRTADETRLRLYPCQLKALHLRP